MQVDSICHTDTPPSKVYPEFGNFSFIEVISKLHIFEVIAQVNTVELIINDILAIRHFTLKGEALSEGKYLDYIESALLGMFIGEKCKKLISVIDENKLREPIEKMINTTVDVVLDDWKDTRNVFAHGQYMVNQNQNPAIYYKGLFFNIEEHTAAFFGIQEKIVIILDMCKSLHSPYYGKLVLKGSSIF